MNALFDHHQCNTTEKNNQQRIITNNHQNNYQNNRINNLRWCSKSENPDEQEQTTETMLIVL